MGRWLLLRPRHRPDRDFTAAFDDICAWLVCHAALFVVAILPPGGVAQRV
jgi:hypothetical protein